MRLKIEPRMLDKTTAAGYCGVSSATFSAECPVKPDPPIGGTIRWDRRKLDAWLDGRTQGKEHRPTKAEILGRLDSVGAAQGH